MATLADRPINLFDVSQDAHEGGLAAAVGTDESDSLAIADAEGDVLQDGLNAVGFVEVVCGKHDDL